jgi:glycosyltransferase involved in cell wall biosynthesis
MKVSVIVPTYNRPELLERALQSIEAQTMKDYEVIVVNDAGVDVEDIVKKFSNTIYTKHTNNRGLSASRNTGIRKSSGDYITFLDDDDIIFPNHLQVLTDAVIAGAEIAYTDAYLWKDDKEYHKFMSNDFDKENILQRNLFPVMCAIVNKKLFYRCKFDESLNSHEDWDLWIRLSKKVNFVHIKKITAAYSKRNKKDQISGQPYHIKAYNKVKARYNQKQENKSVMKSKILLFMPTYEVDGEMKADQRAIDSFYRLIDPPDCDVERVIGLDNPYGLEGKHKNTLHQYQQAQKRVIDEGFDALVTFEHDMIVPNDGLLKLWETDAQVVYGVYVLRHNAHCINAFFHVTGNPTLSKSMTYKKRDYKLAKKKGWAKVSGLGMGFTLFRRDVLERFPFKATELSYPPDWMFAVEATRAGVKQIARFDVECGHIDGKIVLWPSRKGNENMTKVKILKQFVSGQMYKPGMICEIASDKVDDFLRAGYLEILNERKEVKIENKPSEIIKPAVKVVNKPASRRKKAVKGDNN